MKALNQLCRKTGLYPQGLILGDQCPDLGLPVSRGGFALVHRTKLRGHTVAVKFLAFSGRQEGLRVRGISWKDYSHDDPFHQNFASETVVWLHMDHPRILPLYGLFSGDRGIGFVSPWMEQGHVVTFLENHPRTNCLYLVSIRQLRYVIMVPHTIQRQRISSTALNISTAWISFTAI